MKFRSRSIALTSGKGGTGKTMLTANLGIALANQGCDVVILDGDLGMANLAIVMGIHNPPISFLDVLTGDAEVEDAVYENHGVKVVPTGFRFEETQELLSRGSRENVEEVVESLLRQAEFLLIDAPAGITDATIISIAAAREMLPVTNPTYSSLVDCHKTVRLGNVLDTWTRGLVVNRVGRSSDVSREEIEHFMGRTASPLPILTGILEDPTVQEAEREGVPVIVYEPECEASRAIQELSKIITGEEKLLYVPYEDREIDVTIKRLCRALTGGRT